jgi:hypothetical protein
MPNEYDVDASRYQLWGPGWPTAPQSPYGNDLWNALAAITGIHPEVIRRFDAALASSPGFADQDGAAQSDRVAAGYDGPGGRGAGDTAKQFGPSNSGGFADATSPFNPASYGSGVSAPGLASIPIDDRDLTWAVTNTMATLYGQRFRPYMAVRTFGVLDGLVSDTPQAFTMAQVDAALRQLGEISAGQGLDAAAAAIAVDDLRKRMPKLAPTGVLARDPSALPGFGESVSKSPSSGLAGSVSGAPDQTAGAPTTWGESDRPPLTVAFGETTASPAGTSRRGNGVDGAGFDGMGLQRQGVGTSSPNQRDRYAEYLRFEILRPETALQELNRDKVDLTVGGSHYTTMVLYGNWKPITEGGTVTGYFVTDARIVLADAGTAANPNLIIVTDEDAAYINARTGAVSRVRRT